MVLDHDAQASVDSAIDEWPDAERAWQVVEWVLARDPLVGVPLDNAGKIRGFIYRGARSIGQPDIEVIYEILPFEIVVRDAVFSDAQANQAGHG